MPPEKSLVTGGTGFAGSHLVHNLVRDGQQVRVLARSAEKARQILPPEVDVVEGDITDPDAVARSVEGQEVIYHLAAAFREAGIPDSRYHEVHVDGTQYLLEAARAEGIRRFVHCSTIGVHGHVEGGPIDESAPHAPTDIYQETKSEAEKLALDFQRRHQFPLAVARPASIYGPGDMRLLKLFRMIANRRFVMLGSGEPCFHMVYVDDLSRGFRLAAEREEAIGEAFIFAGERTVPLKELVKMIAAAVEVPAPRWRFPVAPVMLAAKVMKAVCVPLGIEPPIYPRRVGFFTHNRSFSIEKARNLLGYCPQVDLETGIRRTAEWYRDHGYLEFGK